MSQDNVSYWTGRWAREETGWHLSQLNPALTKGNFLDNATSILFPLCGKTCDMTILASKYKVAGIEGVHQALDEYADDNGSEFIETQSDINNYKKLQIQVHSKDSPNTANVDFYFGDFFAMDPNGDKVQFDRVFDRGSLVAILPEKRSQYMQIIHSLLKPGGKWMLSTICYDQSEKPGAPHSIGPDDIRVLLDQLAQNVKDAQYTFEVVEELQGKDSPDSSGWLKENGGPLSDLKDYVIILTKLQ